MKRKIPMLCRKKVIIFLSFFILIFSYRLGSCIPKHKNYNIILITLDALRADHLNCYGYKRGTSPFISEFAKDAFIYQRVIAQSGSTMPSLATVFTSMYAYADCALNERDALGKSYTTIAEFLKKIGYKTYAIVGHGYVKKIFGLARGFDYYDDNFDKWRNADEMTTLAIKFLKEGKSHKKFFLWLHYRQPHWPYDPPLKYREMFYQKKPFNGENQSDVYTIFGKKMTLSKKVISELGDLYDANIRFADDALRGLFEYSRESGLLKNTIIIITADHGESLGEHNIFDHNELYYGILRVPLIIRIPEIKGRVVENPVALIDIFPTICELLGYKNAPMLKRFRGKSVFSETKLQQDLYSEYNNRFSLIVDNFRLFQDANNSYVLYNIADDPYEVDNLVSKESQRFDIMKQRMNSLLEHAKSRSYTGKPSLDERTKQNLKSLGYVQ